MVRTKAGTNPLMLRPLKDSEGYWLGVNPVPPKLGCSRLVSLLGTYKGYSAIKTG